MKLPKAKNLKAEKYVAGLSLFKQKFAKIKLSANESALGASPKAIHAFEREKNKNLNSPAEKVVRKYVNTLTADDNNSNYSQQGADHSR